MKIKALKSDKSESQKLREPEGNPKYPTLIIRT